MQDFIVIVTPRPTQVVLGAALVRMDGRAVEGTHSTVPVRVSVDSLGSETGKGLSLLIL